MALTSWIAPTTMRRPASLKIVRSFDAIDWASDGESAVGVATPTAHDAHRAAPEDASRCSCSSGHGSCPPPGAGTPAALGGKPPSSQTAQAMPVASKHRTRASTSSSTKDLPTTLATCDCAQRRRASLGRAASADMSTMTSKEGSPRSTSLA